MTAQHVPELEPGRPRRSEFSLFHPDLRENHRFLADSLADLADFVEEQARLPYTGSDDRAHLHGYRAALIDLSRHLRAGDYLPGGLLNCTDLPA